MGVFEKFRLRPECSSRNIMVCRKCHAVGVFNPALDEDDGDFHIWCLDTGYIINGVRLSSYLPLMGLFSPEILPDPRSCSKQNL